MKNWASLISGGGTTMDAMMDAVKTGEVSGINPALVIASKKSAGGIEKAKKRGVKESDIVVLNPRMFMDGTDFETAQLRFGDHIIEECRRRSIDIITQNGWVKMTPTNVIEEFDGRIFNQHPGSLPYFGGTSMIGTTVHDAVLRYWQILAAKDPEIWNEAHTHMIAQRVAAAYDEGAVVNYTSVPVYSGDTPKELQDRGLPQEYALQIQLLNDFVQGRIQDMPDYRSIVIAGTEDIAAEAKRAAIAAAI